MQENREVAVLSDQEKVEIINQTSFQWRGSYKHDRELVFQRAYEIVHKEFTAPLRDCQYRVNERVFTDLSFYKGETVEEYPDDYEIRRHSDGTLFLFSYEDIPTFDSEDRIWDGMSHCAVYCDEKGINLIHCRHGYRTGGIKVYTGLVRAFPDFMPWLERLGCKERMCDG